ncbi:MEKHLA domain-containing protein [uncultured Thiodictyon sp.]|uniref:MEKHLA domain-containing protein n=1 Tax=uncultured Thiodictyon sp. TaxID=1846217 RepID=UPI0025FAD547|nr:MEKHLA domain-containing protein [uncultured Thiodictyon sp.]
MNRLEPPFPPPAQVNAFLADHIGLLRRSYRHLTGRDLIDSGLTDQAAALALFEAPFALLSHGTQADPILAYGNRTVLRLFELTWEQLTAMPSRYTAQAPNRQERARLLQQVTARGYIDDYCGVRVAASGRRFMIENACVWNLVDAGGACHGQAATFSHWRYLESSAD